MNKNQKIIPGYKYFVSQQDDEEVLLIIRKHWTILLKPFLIGLVLMILAVIIITLLETYGSQYTVGIGNTIFILISSLVFLFTVLYVFTAWLISYLNIIILTSEHLVEIEQSALFNRKISELSLDCVEDVSASQHGFLKTMFHFGDILVQTAGTMPNFEFRGIGYPYESAQKIMEAQEFYSRRKNQNGGSNTPENNLQTAANLPKVEESSALNTPSEPTAP
jgi:hypothetical protein